MGPTKYQALARGHTNTHTIAKECKGEKNNANSEKCRQRDLKYISSYLTSIINTFKTSHNLSSDTMLSYQLSQKLKLLGNGPNDVYQAI